MSSRNIAIGGVEVTVNGMVIRTARLRYEWDTPLSDPEAIIRELRKTGYRVDVFTFAQRLPESRRKYAYPMEWDNVAAIPITDYQTWLLKQIHRNARNKLKKAEKEGVVIRQMECNEELFRRIKEIQDECPVRQGTRFRHYGKDLDTVRKGHSTFLERATFVGAFFNDEIIGYLKVVPTTGFARVMGLLTKTKYNEKAPMNALIAKAVEICAENGIPFLVYAKYSYGKTETGTLADFKANNGFEHILLPRYHVPLTGLGRLALLVRYRDGIASRVPTSVVNLIRGVRARYFEWRFREALTATQRGTAESAAASPVTAAQ